MPCSGSFAAVCLHRRATGVSKLRYQDKKYQACFLDRGLYELNDNGKCGANAYITSKDECRKAATFTVPGLPKKVFYAYSLLADVHPYDDYQNNNGYPKGCYHRNSVMYVSIRARLPTQSKRLHDKCPLARSRARSLSFSVRVRVCVCALGVPADGYTMPHRHSLTPLMTRPWVQSRCRCCCSHWNPKGSGTPTSIRPVVCKVIVTCRNGQYKKTANARVCTAKKTASDCGATEIFTAGKDSEKSKDDTACTACGNGQ